MMKHLDRRIIVTLVHAAEGIGIRLLLKTIKDAKLSKDEFLKLLEQA
jgi:predicted RNA binding protein YcfA (HicA-like mRNA interferase family)